MSETRAYEPAAPRERAGLRGELAALGALAAVLVLFAVVAPGSYQIYLMIHIFAAVVWVGGGTTIAILAFMIVREGDPGLIARFADLTARVGMRVFAPSSLVVLVFGFVLVSKADWGFGHFWVLFALLGWLATFLTGILVLSPQAKRIGQLVPERGVEDPEVQALIRRVILIDRWETLLLLLVVADMAAKPFA